MDGRDDGATRRVHPRRYRRAAWLAAGVALVAGGLVTGPVTPATPRPRPTSGFLAVDRPGPVVRGALAPRADPLPAARSRTLPWVRTWQAAQQPAPPGSVAASGIGARTVRLRAHTSVGGTALRVSISNRYGPRPLVVAGVSVGRPAQADGALPAALRGSLRSLTFRGAPGVRVPAGRAVTSDPVAVVVPGHADLLVSVALSGAAMPLSGHARAESTTWVSARGDHTGDEAGTAFTSSLTGSVVVSALDVVPVAAAPLSVPAVPSGSPSAAPGAGSAPATARRPDPTATSGAMPATTPTPTPTITPSDVPTPAPDAVTVVAFGDSITDGAGSTVDADRRWPDLLAEGLPSVAVANAGISGNRLLRDSPPFGVAGVTRFDADVLDVPGVRVVVVLEGVNDLQQSPRVTTPGPIIDGLAELGDRARARGVRVVLATLTPYGGRRAWSPVGERTRRAVNAWIRRDAVRTGSADAVVDTDAVLRDRADPTRLRPVFDCGDRIHPNDAGYAAVAAAVEPVVRRLLPGPQPAGSATSGAAATRNR